MDCFCLVYGKYNISSHQLSNLPGVTDIIAPFLLMYLSDSLSLPIHMMREPLPSELLDFHIKRIESDVYWSMHHFFRFFIIFIFIIIFVVDLNYYFVLIFLFFFLLFSLLSHTDSKMWQHLVSNVCHVSTT